MSKFCLINGGQTGADYGASRAALDIPCELIMRLPKGYLTEDGPKPEYKEKFGAIEHTTSDYRSRTIRNVSGSHGVFLFGDPNSPGGKLVWNTANGYGDLPVLEISRKVSYQNAREFLKYHDITLLFVGGNRASSDRKAQYYSLPIEDFTYNFLLSTLKGFV